MAPENTENSTPFANPFGAALFTPPVREPEPEVEDIQDDVTVAPPAPAGTAFGLVFQAADVQLPRPHRPELARSRDDELDEVDTEESLDETDDVDASEPDAESEENPDDDEGQTPRRRRRGGRGRRAKTGESEGAEDAAESAGTRAPRGKQQNRRTAEPVDEEVEENESDDDTLAQSDDANDSTDDRDNGGNRRRTRRRRRSGAGSAEADEPNTVTKVREPRHARDEVTSIKGSTRLEAKKQRRREGREAGRRRTVVTEAEFLARRESVERVMVVREQEGRTQIGVLEDGVLAEHYVSRDQQASSMAGNVYLGRVQNVLPSMEAAFVDIGRGRNAVLYAGEVNWDAAGLDNQPKRIEHALKAGESVLVQVTKDPIGHKGARLTSQISLPGRFLVYVPGNSMTGISRKLPDTERARLKKILKEVVPADAGVIVRTAAEGASEEELRADVERLTSMWEKIQKKAEKGNAPVLLHGEPDLTVRVIRDVFNEDFAKMIVSGDKAWGEVHSYISDVAPDLAERLERWEGERDVFAKYRIDEQLAKAMDRTVWLPSGGSLVIDRTEAMTVVDVNTGKFIGSGGNLEETVTKNNIEAAEEIVRQLRLRDIGGIIVVDFIDMVLESNRDLVVRRLLECLGRDRTKHQVAEVTSLGLVQMTRKRVGAGLVEVFSEPCDACHGRGIVIHDHPVEHRDINGNDMSRRGRGRKGGRDQAPNSNAPQRPEETAADKAAAKENKFAAIAAAAHAAAVAKDDKPRNERPSTPEAIEDAAPMSGRVERRPRTERTDPGVVAATPAPAAETKPEPKRRGPRRAAASTGAPVAAGTAQVMTVSATTTPGTADAPGVSAPAESAPTATTGRATTGQEAAPAAARTKRSRRAASSAGSAVTLQPVDLTTPAAPTSAPLTKVAGDASSVAAVAPEAEATAAAGRRKRTRVVAPAGAPTAQTLESHHG